MPVFEYQCKSCNSQYDIYHKVREVVDDVVCPTCSSKEHKRLMSATQVSMSSYSSPSYSSAPSCDTGGCCGGGSCGIN
ncbi:MAG: zinc ribbon domain-containing protein [Ignavibacteriae bacterium]|nr:zinc ribbon domain-containing protein [Ignavibacteriota bacterium]